MNLHPSESVPASQTAADALKFTYPSGARPLEGYTLKRGIGRGGFGEVYFAVSDAGKEVALKLIRRHLDVELRGVRQCLNLKHPNLLAIHDIRADSQDDRWVVMEYISGDSLEAAIERNPNGMPVEEVLNWFRGIVAGVAYLHDRGIVHRDLKPGNIFQDEGIIKIGDYGLAKFVSCSRRSGQTETVGTVHYMAPEISRGRYGKEIDTYALGIILYEMLTGRAPFEGESVAEVLMKHLDTTPDLSPLTPAFKELVGRALQKDPAQRFSHVREMLALLPGGGGESAAAGLSSAHFPSGGPNSHPAGNAGTSSIPTADDLEAEVPSSEIELVQDEPIWRWVKGTFQNLSDAWHEADLNPFVRISILLMMTFLMLASAVWLFPVAFVLTFAYTVYACVRAIVLHSIAGRPARRVGYRGRRARRARRQAGPQQANQQPERFERQGRRTESWRREQAKVTLVPVMKTAREKLTELTGSMLISALVAGVMALVMMVLRHKSVMQPEQFVWLSITAVLGSWLVMVPSKLWEGTEVEPSARRFTLLVAGLLWGAMAFGLANFLSVELQPAGESYSTWLGDYGRNLHTSTGEPTWVVYLAYFGFLLFLLRWWRQADPQRGTRLSLWSTAVCVFTAWVLQLFWPFPQPWGLMLAASVAISVQLASPWQVAKQGR